VLEVKAKTNERELVDIVRDLKFVTSNKVNISQSKALFIGLSYEIVSRRDLFPRNIDLRIFTDEMYVPYTKKKEPFKEYLFSSRTLLGARIGGIILYDIEYDDLIEMVNRLIDLLSIQTSLSEKKNNSKINNSDITDWLNVIRSNR
jgi:hypothetical protein